MVPGGGYSCPVALHHPRAKFRAWLHGHALGRSRQLAEHRQHGIHLGHIEAGQDAAQQLRKRPAHGVAGAVGLFHQGSHIIGERHAAQGGSELGERRICQRYSADRLSAGGAAHFQFDGLVAAVEDPGVVDLGKIMIFGGQPEERHGWQPLGRQPFRQPDGMQNFVEGIRRAGEQPHLLAGDDGDGSRLGQLLKRRTIGIVLPQRAHQSLALTIRKLDFRGCVLKIFQVAQGVVVKRGGAVRMVKHVCEQGRRMR